MTAVHALLIALAGVWAGAINTIVGSGSLVTFPALLAFGVPPVTANVSNNLGLIPGGFSGTWGYRRELRAGLGRLRRLAPATASGAVIGSLLLIWLPQRYFRAVVPVLIVVGLVLVVLGPRLQARMRQREPAGGPVERGGLLWAGVFAAGVYGGYFGAAQGVILMGLLSSLTLDPLQRLNAVKNGLGTVANLVAGLVFLLAARSHIDWAVAGVIAVGTLTGGFLGAHLGRRLPPAVLRVVIVVVGVVALVRFVAG